MSQPLFEKIGTGYFTLKLLATYTSCSVRWLRDRLSDPMHPLPHFRIAGKILIKREDFDVWIAVHRVDKPSCEISELVDSVISDIKAGHDFLTTQAEEPT